MSHNVAACRALPQLLRPGSDGSSTTFSYGLVTSGRISFPLPDDFCGSGFRPLSVVQLAALGVRTQARQFLACQDGRTAAVAAKRSNFSSGYRELLLPIGVAKVSVALFFCRTFSWARLRANSSHKAPARLGSSGLSLLSAPGKWGKKKEKNSCLTSTQ
jgi:hypothetical protein